MNDKKRITPIVLAGGKGTRLWPMSRSSRPKQFLSLTGDLSLFQQSLQRLNDPSRYNAPIVITNEDYRFLVAEQAQECGCEVQDIILEPVARNTAAAITAATLVAAKNHPHQLVHILASDHDIKVNAAYQHAVDCAAAAAQAGRLVTFGIAPSEPATGFGYIEVGDCADNGTRNIIRFVEKPNAKRAKKMLKTGNFLWNSGMFLFDAKVFLQECQKLSPEVFSAADFSTRSATKDLDFLRLDADAFSASPDISVDYAIFERTKLATVVPASIIWSDLGTWDAVWKNGPRDPKTGNLNRGPTSLNNTNNSLVMSQKMHVVVDGMDDIAVIASEDAVYVGHLSKAQNVGAVVKRLRETHETQHLTETHQTSYRPWGGYALVLDGARFQVKRLFVKPGKRLSLQKHHHRSEHWVVVHGTAEVQLGDETKTLRENESIYIPQGDVHRLTNPGKITLELIEIQTGSYLGEDDIIRLEDEFGRV